MLWEAEEGTEGKEREGRSGWRSWEGRLVGGVGAFFF